MLTLIALACLLCGCYTPGRGYLESRFDLVMDARLPKFFDTSGQISPRGYKARVELYSSDSTPESSARVMIVDPSGRTVFDKQAKSWWHPLDDKDRPAGHFPNHTVVSFDGVLDIFEQRRMEPLLYLSDDRKLWDALKATPCTRHRGY
jgi:hypothetical protein